jgi:hypothetical protein
VRKHRQPKFVLHQQTGTATGGAGAVFNGPVNAPINGSIFTGGNANSGITNNF